MRTTSTQYPKSRVKDHAVQMNGFGKVDAAVQNANTTRNVMVETCYKMTYSPNFVVSEDIGVQCSEDYVNCDDNSVKRTKFMAKKQYSEDLGSGKGPHDAILMVRRASLPESTHAGSPVNSPRAELSGSPIKTGNDLRLINTTDDNDVAKSEIIGLNDDNYSSDWDSGDEQVQGVNSSDATKPERHTLGPTSSHVSIAVREDAHY